MNTSDARDLFSDSPDDGWRPLSVQTLAEDLRSTHPQITVLRFHAKGGMGAIYEGRLRDEKDGNINVAIKVLRPDAADDAGYVRRFRREQDILATLGDHPHIIRHRLHGTTSEGYPFLVMDWVEGRSLVEFTGRGSTTDRRELLQITNDICSAVQHAHEHDILHRDLKPQNIIVTDKGRAIVLDFGIARSLKPGNTLTQPGDSPGTLGYIAPEVRNGEKPDARADIYSLGIIIYQLFVKGPVPEAFAKRPSEQSLDPRFDEIVMNAANPEREKRYGSAGALWAVLKELADPKITHHIVPETKDQKMKPHIVIHEDRIIINGVVFRSQTRLQELTCLLGEPVLGTYYIDEINPRCRWDWKQHGISAFGWRDSECIRAFDIWLVNETEVRKYLPPPRDDELLQNTVVGELTGQFDGRLEAFGQSCDMENVATRRNFLSELLAKRRFTDKSDPGEVTRNAHLNRRLTKRYQLGSVSASSCEVHLVLTEQGHSAHDDAYIAYVVGFHLADFNVPLAKGSEIEISQSAQSFPQSHTISPRQLLHTNSSLQDGEVPVFVARKHWSAILPWLAALAPVAFISFLFGTGPGLIIGGFLIICLVQYFSNEYVVTNRRVLIREGILNRTMKDEELLSIKKIGVSMSWLDTLLGRGSVTLGGTGGDTETLAHLADPEGFRDAIQKMQNQRRTEE